MVKNESKFYYRLYEEWAIPFLFIVLLSTATTIPNPFFSNQNQYFAQSVTTVGTPLVQDWFVHTISPYPIFNIIGKYILQHFGKSGIVYATYPIIIISFTAVYILSMILNKSNRTDALAVTAGLAATLQLPGTIPTAFQGFGGQYIMENPVYLQPSAFGCFLLMGFVLLLMVCKREINGRRAAIAIFLCFGCVLLCCLLHPTYLTSVALALTATVFADCAALRRLPPIGRIWWYALSGLAILAIVLMLNPSLLAMGSANLKYQDALIRFAYERIPHHTIWSRWPHDDLIMVIVIVSAACLRWKQGDVWLCVWLSSALTMCLASALAAPYVPGARLALLFPWRLSVVLVPISAVCIGNELLRVLKSGMGKMTSLIVLGVLVLAIGIAAVWHTRNAQMHSEFDEATQLIAQTHPQGIGLIPPDLEQVRLNAPAAIYVDLKSPPYASADLLEWWARIDTVRAIDRDSTNFCRHNLQNQLSWILLPRGNKQPACTLRWRSANSSLHYNLLTK